MMNDQYMMFSLGRCWKQMSRRKKQLWLIQTTMLKIESTSKMMMVMIDDDDDGDD
jgi:hypothetical protein